MTANLIGHQNFIKILSASISATHLLHIAEVMPIKKPTQIKADKLGGVVCPQLRFSLKYSLYLIYLS